MLAALSAATPGLRAELRAFRSSASGWGLLHQVAHGADFEAAVALVETYAFDARAVDLQGRVAADVAQAAGAHELAAWLRVKMAG